MKWKRPALIAAVFVVPAAAFFVLQALPNRYPCKTVFDEIQVNKTTVSEAKQLVADVPRSEPVSDAETIWWEHQNGQEHYEGQHVPAMLSVTLSFGRVDGLKRHTLYYGDREYLDVLAYPDVIVSKTYCRYRVVPWWLRPVYSLFGA